LLLVSSLLQIRAAWDGDDGNPTESARMGTVVAEIPRGWN